jgi:hypothetical protein
MAATGPKPRSAQMHSALGPRSRRRLGPRAQRVCSPRRGPTRSTIAARGGGAARLPHSGALTGAREMVGESMARLTDAWTAARHDGIEGGIGWHDEHGRRRRRHGSDRATATSDSGGRDAA